MIILELAEKSVIKIIGSEMLVKEMGDKDSIHLACAEVANADVLLTTDIKFMNNSNRIKTYTKVMNPNQWLLEVLY